jgi:hypothetical protein
MRLVMVDASWSGLATTLITVVVGGLIGLAGGWLGPWLLERRKEAAEKKRKRAEKFEELVAAVYDFDHWNENFRRSTVFGEQQISTVSPFHKLQAIFHNST